MASFEKVLGRKREALDPSWFHNLVAQFETVALDIGTGDGRFILDGARAAPATLWVGLDPVAENMADSARAAAASVRKGGLANALFLRAAAEQLPGPLNGIADRISINYPWGSLLRIVTLPDVAVLKQLATCGKAGAHLAVYLNHSVFEDRAYLARLGLNDLPDPAIEQHVIDGYVTAGFDPPSRRLFAGDPPFRSQWGRHLVRGSDRKTLLMETRIGSR